MTELRHIETNAADDSAGRAFGLEGNLYLPVLLSVLGALALFAVLGLVARLPLLIAGLAAAVPLTAVLGWVLLLKHGRPAGYDRDLIEYWLNGGHFTRVATEQGRMVA